MSFTNKKNHEQQNQSKVTEVIDQRKLHDLQHEQDLSLDDQEYKQIQMNFKR